MMPHQMIVQIPTNPLSHQENNRQTDPPQHQNTRPQNEETNKASQSIHSLIDELVSDLKGMNVEDLRSLYHNVKDALKDRNGYVADFNSILTSVMGCNTNSLFLGSREQSKGALFYIGPYICKNLVEIIDSFDLLLEAQEYARKFPSRADNSHTEERFVQHVITRVLNKMNSLMEVSDTQAAAALLGLNAGICSDIFSAYDPSAYEKFVAQDFDSRCSGNDKLGDDGHDDTGGDDNSMDSFIVQDHVSEEDSIADIDSVSENDGKDDGTRAIDMEAMDVDCPFETSTPNQTNYQSCPIYRVDNGGLLIPIPYPKLYRYRGRALKDLSRYEYCTQVKVMKKQNDSEKTCDQNKRGRKKANGFEFGEGFELTASHEQMLRLKLCTLKLYQSPPPHPGKRPNTDNDKIRKWNKKANQFAAFFLMLFRPESDLYQGGQVNRYSYDWKALIRYTKQLKEGNHFDKMRYRTMRGYMHGWRSNVKARAILSNYRARSRTIWNKETQDMAMSRFGKKTGSSTGRAFLDDDEDGPDMQMFELSNQEQLAIMKNVSFGDDMRNTLLGVAMKVKPEEGGYGETDCTSQNSNDKQETNFIPLRFSLPHPQIASVIMDNAVLDDNDGGDEHDEAAPVTDEENDGDYTTSADVEIDDSDLRNHFIRQQTQQRSSQFIQSKLLSDDKQLAVSIMQSHFDALYDGIRDDYKAPVLLITGGPGVGKSFLVDVIDGVSKIMRVGEQLRLALYGIAAVNIDGVTLISMMDIPIEFKKNTQQRINEWNPAKLRMFKNMYDLSKISAIIIDEISTVKPYMLAYLNSRLQTACNSKKPFGGKAVVVLGDFQQLPPAGGPSIPEVAMMIEKEKYLGETRGKTMYKKKQFEVTTIITQGVRLFTNATHIKLTTQHRSEDQSHTNLLEKMSTGQSLCEKDFDLYKTLDESDKDFEFATILTPGNRERHEFNDIQAKRWAKRHNTNVLRWPRRINDKSWRGKPRNPMNVARAKQESCFWELFVPDALAYLTFNLNGLKRLVNGTPVKYHSVSFLDRNDQDKIEEQISQADPGDVITLLGPPDFVNVEIFPDFPGDSDKILEKNKELRSEWKYGNIITDGSKVVIPIGIAKSRQTKWKGTQIRGGGGVSRFKPSKVDLSDWFTIEPGFSTTIHKAQVCYVLVVCCKAYIMITYINDCFLHRVAQYGKLFYQFLNTLTNLYE